MKYINSQEDFFDVLNELNQRETEIYDSVDELKNRKEKIL